MTTLQTSEANLLSKLSFHELDRLLTIAGTSESHSLAQLPYDDDDSEEQQDPEPPKHNDGSQRDPDELIKSWRREDGPDKKER
jgi:hypothetical protein